MKMTKIFGSLLSLLSLSAWVFLLSCSAENASNDGSATNETSFPNDLSDNSIGGIGDDCVPAKLSKDTLYFHKHGGFDSVVVTGTIWSSLLKVYGYGYYGYGGYNGECKSIVANFSFMTKDVPISILDDFCENNYCHEIISGIISVKNDYCKDNYCHEEAAWITVRDDSCENNYCYEFPSVIYNHPRSAPVTKIECSWYSVAHTSKESLLISVDKNETGKERSIYVPLQTAYTCGSTGFTIIQSAGNE
ncbi:MAG: hypothetical protein LBQ87_07790 [Candidatus Fibromonas sp.]|jgi:hypothetical protein|nr:hypothetical protein [Candidatus Fibromonas sp.]